MTIEALLTKLIESLDANTAAHLGKAAPAKSKGDDDGEEEKSTAKSGSKSTAKSTSKAKAKDEEEEEDEKTTSKSKSKKITREELTAIMNKVKDDLGAPEAKAIIKSFKVDRLAEIDDDDIEAAYKKAEAKLEKASKDGKDNDDDNL